MKTTFQLPKTKLTTVVWYRGNEAHETLIETPHSNDELRNAMLQHKVGFSEIRAVKAVDPNALAKAMMAF